MPQTYRVGARSLFVTATAWIFILLGALASASALIQNAAVASLMPGLQVGAGSGNAALPLLTGLLVFAIVANLLGLWLQQEVLQSVVHNTLSSVSIPAQALAVFGGFVTAARVMAVLMTLIACLLLGWIIRRLMSRSIRQEFA